MGAGDQKKKIGCGGREKRQFNRFHCMTLVNMHVECQSQKSKPNEMNYDYIRLPKWTALKDGELKVLKKMSSSIFLLKGMRTI